MYPNLVFTVLTEKASLHCAMYATLIAWSPSTLRLLVVTVLKKNCKIIFLLDKPKNETEQVSNVK